MIRGIVFDKDGTLFDFNATWRGVMQETLKALAPGDPDRAALMARAVGYDPGTGTFAGGSAIVAGSSADVARIWAEFLPATPVAALEAALNARAETVGLGDLVPAAADLPGLLDVLRAMGCALGVATHDSEAGARSHLGLVGVLDRFDFIAGYDSGHGLKPGPGMVLAFCAHTGLDPAEVAMIGDSVHDLGAGRSAGAALVVGVLTGPAPRSELAPLADMVLRSIEDLPAALRSLAAV
ncbi:MAG: phosphoglycolate phosphatase [Paracoccaceae bacterium]|jgi:phosphoglycolate phosphatase